MVDSVVTFLLDNLSRLLEDEHKLLSGVEDKINSLCNELKFIHIFLKNSEGKRSHDTGKEVVSQIRDVAHKAENVVDTYVANIAQQKQRSKLSKLFHLKEHVMVLHQVNSDIEKIRTRIDEIYKNRDRYGIGEGDFRSEEAAAEAEPLLKRRREVEEEDVVGLVHDSSHVIQELMESESRLKVVSIIGMGGLGKTTLARKIYNNNQEQLWFPCLAWVSVSNDYRPKEFLLSLLKCSMSSTSEFEELSEAELKKKVAEWLKGKKYLVVLDDIWETQVWDEVKGAFPDDQTGSRILITSRNKEVAHYAGTASPYYLPILNEDESWELFTKKIFRGEECPSDLEPLGRSIVKTCGGLPLAIVVLAGLVAKKEKSQREWSRIKDVSWHLTEDKTGVMDILKLSYNNLPGRLKPCFLYFGIYPEDYEISAKQLIQYWIAEGFIQPQKTGIADTTELEDVADFYLDELVDRSLVQVAKRRSDGGVKTCRIHDLLRDLCLSESKSDKFLEICTDSNIDTVSNTNPRRMSIHWKGDLNVSVNTFNKSCTRSMFIFGGIMVLDPVLKNFKLARVLDCDTFFARWSHTVSRDLKRMIHLRYLRIGVKHLPDCVCSLWNLETLHVTYETTVSSKIWTLKRLRHLYLIGEEIPVVLPKANRMENLQTLLLSGKYPQQIIFLLNSGIFPRLRKLGLRCYNSVELEPAMLPSLQRLSNLHSLKVIEYLELPSDTNAFPSNLTKITLDQAAFRDPQFFMKTLGRLPNLQILKLIKCRDDILLDIGRGEFPQLQVLHMRGIHVRQWRLEKDAMPRLRHLFIDICYKLSELPEELWSMTALRLVHVRGPSEELANSLKNVEPRNGCKLKISNELWKDKWARLQTLQT